MSVPITGIKFHHWLEHGASKVKFEINSHASKEQAQFWSLIQK